MSRMLLSLFVVLLSCMAHSKSATLLTVKSNLMVGGKITFLKINSFCTSGEQFCSAKCVLSNLCAAYEVTRDLSTCCHGQLTCTLLKTFSDASSNSATQQYNSSRIFKLDRNSTDISRNSAFSNNATTPMQGQIKNNLEPSAVNNATSIIPAQTLLPTNFETTQSQIVTNPTISDDGSFIAEKPSTTYKPLLDQTTMSAYETWNSTLIELDNSYSTSSKSPLEPMAFQPNPDALTTTATIINEFPALQTESHLDGDNSTRSWTASSTEKIFETTTNSQNHNSMIETQQDPTILPDFCSGGCAASAMYTSMEANNTKYTYIICQDNYVYQISNDRWCEALGKQKVALFYKNYSGSVITAATFINDGVLLIDSEGASHFYKNLASSGDAHMVKDDSQCMPTQLEGMLIKFATKANNFVLFANTNQQAVCAAEREFICSTNSRRRRAVNGQRPGDGQRNDDGPKDKDDTRDRGGHRVGSKEAGGRINDNSTEDDLMYNNSTEEDYIYNNSTEEDTISNNSTEEGTIYDSSTEETFYYQNSSANSNSGSSQYTAEEQQDHDDCIATGNMLISKSANAIDQIDGAIYIFNETSGRPTKT